MQVLGFLWDFTVCIVRYSIFDIFVNRVSLIEAVFSLVCYRIMSDVSWYLVCDHQLDVAGSLVEKFIFFSRQSAALALLFEQLLLIYEAGIHERVLQLHSLLETFTEGKSLLDRLGWRLRSHCRKCWTFASKRALSPAEGWECSKRRKSFWPLTPQICRKRRALHLNWALLSCLWILILPPLEF